MTTARNNQWGQTMNFHPENRNTVPKSNTKNAVHMCFHPLFSRSMLQVTKHTTHMKNLCRKSYSQAIHLFLITNLRSQSPWLSPPLAIPWKSILRHIPWNQQASEVWRHTLMKSSLAEDKGVHDRIDSDLDIQWCHAPTSEYLQPYEGGEHKAGRWLSARNSSGPNYLYGTNQFCATPNHTAVANGGSRRDPRPTASHLHPHQPHGGHPRKVATAWLGALHQPPMQSLPHKLSVRALVKSPLHPPHPSTFGIGNCHRCGQHRQ
jgi:hypothetical protein